MNVVLDRTKCAFFLGAALGGIVASLLANGFWAPAPAQAQAPAQPAADSLETLRAEIEVLKAKAPDQAHAMADVGYQFTNLWFAARHENWPLADFYYKETKSHLNWAVRIIPIRKDNAGQEIDLRAILQSLENSPLKEVERSIASKDRAAFEEAYKRTLEGCYACHKASDKPYIHPRIPTEPAASIINFDPRADWPK